MDEKPKSIWKKSWSGWRAFLLFAVSGFAVVLAIGIAAGVKSPAAGLAGIIVGVALLVWLLVAAIRGATRPRNFKRLLFGLACFATLIALFYAEENWRGKHAWNQFKYAWEAKGEKFDLASVWPAPVPANQNFALTPIVFTSYGYILTRDGKRIPSGQRDPNFVQRIAMETAYRSTGPTNAAGNREKIKFTNLEGWQGYYRDLSAKTNVFPVPAQPQSPAQDVLLALSKYDAVIEELRQASQLPYSRFPLDYDNENPAEILLPHLAALKKCSQILQLRSLAELQNGQPEKALADLKLILSLIGKIQNEPILISHLVRIAMLQITLQPVWEGLAEHRWTDVQLVVLDAELAKLDFRADYQLAMRSEMVGFQIGFTDYLRRHPEQLATLGDLAALPDDGGQGGNSSLPGKWFSRMIPAGWFYQNQLRCVRMMVEYYIPVAEANRGIFSPALAGRGGAAVRAETKSFSPFNVLERLMLPALGNCAKKFAYAQASVDLARTAIALERYRLAHGEYPESLDVLAPQFIAKVPHDVIGGQPLKYRREANGQFVLYSVGWNEKDDGGVTVIPKGSTQPKFEEGDWVWRYPSK